MLLMYLPNMLNQLKRSLIMLPAVFSILLVSYSSLAENSIYTVGIVPQYDARRLYKIWRPILDELEQRTGLRFELKGSPTIPRFENKFMSGEFDFSYMNPYHMLLASDAEGYIPLVRDVGRTLHGVLVVRQNSGIESVQELDNVKIAFPAPNAVGASLQIRQELTDEFNINVDPIYVKSHDSVYLNVAIGQTAAGGGVQKTLKRQPANIRNKLRVIHSTRPISPHPFAAHPRVPEEIRNKVRDALISLGESESGKQLLAEIPINRIGAAAMADYEPLKNMKLDRFFISSN